MTTTSTQEVHGDPGSARPELNSTVERNAYRKLLDVSKSFLRQYGTLMGVVVLCLIFGRLSPYFLTPSNFMNIFRQATVVTVVALGLTMVLAGGGFDISVGAVAGFANVLTAFLLRAGIPFGTAIIIALAAGALLGCINGFMVTKLGINSFLATVAMMFFASGLDLLLSGGVRLMVPAARLVAVRSIGVGMVGPVPILFMILLVICAVCYVFLNWTRFGRYIYAVGGNPRTANLSGISITRYSWLTYILCSLLAACGGVLLTTRLSSGVPLAGIDLLGDSINAAFIGMTVITVGRANVFGTLVGGLLLAIMSNGLVLLNVPFYYQYIIWGAIIVLAISFSGTGLSEAMVVAQIGARKAGVGARRFVSQYGTPLLMIALALLLGILRPAFLQFANLMDILRYSTLVAIIAIGLTFPIASGGFDISIGSVASLSTVLLAYALSLGHSLSLAIVEALAAGLVVGLINGLLCSRLGLNPFVATLATLLAATGPQYLMSGGGRPISYGRQPILELIGKGYVGPIPVLVVVLIVVGLFAYLVFSRTILGAHISALGGNPQALHVSGVNVVRTSTVAYIICGLLAALGGVLLTARLGSGMTKVAQPYLMDAIAAVYLGTAFLSRGRPHVLGTLAGAIFMGMTTNGLTMLGVPLWGDYLFRGLMVFGAVALSGQRSR